MNYPAKIYEIATKAPLYKYETKTNWTQIVAESRSTEDVLHHVHRDAAYKITSEFVRNIHEHMTKYSQSEPDGYTVRFSSVALRYDELLELIYTAYREGQTDGMRRDFNPNIIGE
jgi:hypothetical protein